MLVRMKKTCLPAWPKSGTRSSAPKSAPRYTKKSMTLAMMPTGQAQTRRFMPNQAEATPMSTAISSIQCSW